MKTKRVIKTRHIYVSKYIIKAADNWLNDKSVVPSNYPSNMERPVVLIICLPNRSLKIVWKLAIYSLIVI